MNFEEIYKQFLKTGREIGKDTLNELDNMIREDEREKQRKKDIISAIKAFIDLKVNDDQIFTLVNEYYKVDSIEKVNEYINEARKSYQIKQLKKYCESLGMSSSDFRKYSKEVGLDERLKKEPKLLRMQSARLKELLDKDIII